MESGADSETDVSLREGALWFGFAAVTACAITVLVGGLLLAQNLGSSGGDPAAAESSEEASDSADGAEVFAANCASCHGPDGEGGVGPPFEGIVDRLSDPADHVAVVVGGQGGMPAFESTLTAGEIDAVVAYERSVLNES